MKIALLLTLLLPLVPCKIFDNCDLARQLIKYGMPRDEIATWVCIIFKESSYNTEAFNKYSQCYGLFQICAQWWCSPSGRGCNMKCSQLTDDNIADDVKCAKKVFQQTKRLTGNGFTAWETYPYCRNADDYINNCNL